MDGFKCIQKDFVVDTVKEVVEPYVVIFNREAETVDVM